MPVAQSNLQNCALAIHCHHQTLHQINTKNCSLSTVLTATDQKLQKSLKRWYYPPLHCLNVNVMLSKVFPYSLPSVGPGAYPGVQAVSPQVTWSESRHMPSSSLPLLSARPAFYLRSFHQMALPVNGSTHLIPAYYSFYRPRKDGMKGWVGLGCWVIWPF